MDSNRMTTAALVTALALLAGSAFPATSAADDEMALADLSWLVGGWSSGEGDQVFEEYWTAESASQMLGMSRFMGGGKVRLTELMYVEQGPDGIAYRVRHFGPTLEDRGEGVSVFHLTAASPDHAVFELPENEFPSRITYRRTEEGLLITLEGERNGRPAAEKIRMKPIPPPR